jgi:Ni,Fe-hydrogenase maturation factor
MGNKERGDDAFGPYIVENFQETDNIKKIDCNLYPENYLNKIIDLRPELIIFLDTIKKQDSGIILYSYERLSDETIAIADRIIDILNSLDKQKNLNTIGTYETLFTTLR